MRVEKTMMGIRVVFLGAAAVAAAACVNTSTSTCASGARCPAGSICIERMVEGVDAGPGGASIDYACEPVARVHACTNRMEYDRCVYDPEIPNTWCIDGVCTESECGDEHLDRALEVCDDGNIVDADGCSADCQRRCGDGVVQGGEFCEVNVALHESCLDLGYDMGPITCDMTCRVDSIEQCETFEWHPMLDCQEDWHFARLWVFPEKQAVAVGFEGGVAQSPVDAALCGITEFNPSDPRTWPKCGRIFRYANNRWEIDERFPAEIGGIKIPLTDVWASSANDIYTVGALGRIWHFDGEDWARMPVEGEGFTYQLVAVWGTKSGEMFAVGSDWDPRESRSQSQFLILHYDGSTWKRMGGLPEIPGSEHWYQRALFGIWASSPDDVFAVGSYGTILHYDGNQEENWTVMEVPELGNINFHDVWGTLGRDVVAVGSDGVIVRYAAQQWSREEAPIHRAFTGVWGTEGGQMFVVGEGGTLLGHDPRAGNEWRVLGADVWPTMTSVHGSSASDVVALGLEGTALHRHDTGWVAMDLPGNRGLPISAIWGSDGCIYAADGAGQTWRLDNEDDLVWAPMPSEPGDPHSIIDIHGWNCNSVFAVTMEGRILRSADGEGGGRWDVVPAPDQPTASALRAVWVGPKAVFAVGSDGTILRYDKEASKSERMSAPTREELWGVWGASESDVYAVGNEGAILHYDGKEWTKMPDDPIGNFRSFRRIWGSVGDGTTATEVFAVGEGMTILRLEASADDEPSDDEGPEWMAMPVRQSSSVLKTVWGRHSKDVFAGSEVGEVFHYDGMYWSQMRSPTNATVTSIWSFPNGHYILLGDAAGRIFRRKIDAFPVTSSCPETPPPANTSAIEWSMSPATGF